MKISVIIPAYNAEKTIEKCLKALSSQSLRPREIIVVDDHSSDNTVGIAKRWARVISNKRRKGPGGARNCGASLAKGEILAFIDSDCIPPRHWLKKISQAFSSSNVGAAGGGYSAGIDNGFWQRFCAEELHYRRRHWVGAVKTLVSNNMACKKEIFSQKGGFPEQYPVCEDMLLSYKIALENKVLWLKDNDIKHNFKNSLIGFLKHQYFFGKESTRFFLQNPLVLEEGNHQGRELHLAILLVFGAVLSFIFATILVFLKLSFESRFFLVISLIFLIGHFLIYIQFLIYLKSIRFTHLLKAYLVSLLRDLLCGLAFLDGLFCALFC